MSLSADLERGLQLNTKVVSGLVILPTKMFKDCFLSISLSSTTIKRFRFSNNSTASTVLVQPAFVLLIGTKTRKVKHDPFQEIMFVSDCFLTYAKECRQMKKP